MPAIPAPVRDAVLLLARLILGVVLFAHGWQKFMMNGLDATAAGFEQMGVPLPAVSAALAGTIELVTGVAIILGALLPVAAVLVVFVMAGAAIFAHIGNGLFATDGGWELVAVIGAAAAILGVVGGGRYSLDSGFLSGRKAQSESLRENAMSGHR